MRYLFGERRCIKKIDGASPSFLQPEDVRQLRVSIHEDPSFTQGSDAVQRDQKLAKMEVEFVDAFTDDDFAVWEQQLSASENSLGPDYGADATFEAGQGTARNVNKVRDGTLRSFSADSLGCYMLKSRMNDIASGIKRNLSLVIWYCTCIYNMQAASSNIANKSTLDA